VLGWRGGRCDDCSTEMGGLRGEEGGGLRHEMVGDAVC